jgi:hypothetical protein
MAGRIDGDDWQTAMAAFLDQPETWDWLVSWARAAECLPIYCDWTHAFGVTRHGEVVAWEHEPWAGVGSRLASGPVSDVLALNLALHQGKERYPWLAALLPPRPIDARTCSVCSGTGRLPAPAICYCGGAGWVPASH